MATKLAEIAVEAHVRTASDEQEGLVNVRNLERYFLGGAAAHRHHDATSLFQVGDGFAVGDFVLDSFHVLL